MFVKRGLADKCREQACGKKTQQEYKTQQPEHADCKHARILVLETYCAVSGLELRSPVAIVNRYV